MCGRVIRFSFYGSKVLRHVYTQLEPRDLGITVEQEFRMLTSAPTLSEVGEEGRPGVTPSENLDLRLVSLTSIEGTSVVTGCDSNLHSRPDRFRETHPTETNRQSSSSRILGLKN